jgi:hypothetical protein
MRWLKKYTSILFLLSIFPIAWFVGRNFVIEPSTEIYAFIPQESDVVIEVNNVNFISEFAYQRLYHEDYVKEKIDFDDVETKTGINYFSKIILFREQWANEYVWFAVLAYTDRETLKAYIRTKLKGSHMAFGKGHCVVQLSKSLNQAAVNERLKQIAGKKIKPFTARINLNEYFKSDKEINCYIIPPSNEYQNKLIDGHLSFEFLQDHVDIQGGFTPVSGMDEIPSIDYVLNQESAFSLRSSLNVFNSIYWFSKEKIDDVPEYSQMALDYNGVRMSMVDGTFGYEFPFKKFPDMQLKFELINQENWQGFYDTLIANGTIRVDTTVNSLATKEGTFFKYVFNEDVFELGKDKIQFQAIENSEIYFDMQLQIEKLIDNTTFAVDENNPPSSTMQMIFMAVANDMMEDLRVLGNVEKITFQLRKDTESNINAEGKMLMTNKEGHSIIESLLFAKESIFFISQALEVASDM